MKITKELKLGAFAVTVLVCSFFLINYLRGEDIFDREYEVVSRFDRLEGLVASAPVYIKGYKVGKVSEVVYDNEADEFVVTCSISNDFNVPEDSKMTIYSVDIMGSKGIRIELGASSELVCDGGELQPCFETGLMDSLSAGIVPLLDKVNGTLDSLSVTVSSVNSLLSESNRVRISNTLTHIESTMSNLNSLSASLDGKSDEVEDVIDNLAVLSSKFVGIADKADSSVQGVNEIIDGLNEADLKGLLTSIRSLVENINDPDGSIGKLLTEDSVYNSIDELLTDINLLVKKIQENPKKYLKISVF